MSSLSVTLRASHAQDEPSAVRLLGHLMLLFAAALLIVTVVSFVRDGAATSIVFFFAALGCAVGGLAIWILARRATRRFTRPGLLILFLAYLLGPAAAAAPVYGLWAGASFTDAYFEMASAMTTTGATGIRGVDTLPSGIVLWRSLLAAIGGFVCLVSCLAIMAPLMIGGFEVEHYIEREDTGDRRLLPAHSDGIHLHGVEGRVLWAARVLGPPYFVVFMTSWLATTAAGVPVFDAACLALCAISTTGFSPTDAGVASYANPGMEMVLLLTIIPAAIGVTKHVRAWRGNLLTYLKDPELKYMAIAIGATVILIFARHWIGAIETRSTDEVAAGIAALWGAFFMAVSFVTTTGFESASWDGATAWSGLQTPGVTLVGLAIVGGGAASTAGGVKLLRAALLAKHSRAELLRLSRPTASISIRSGGRIVSNDALRIIFVFVMLFVLALAGTALALSATGVEMIPACIAAISAVSNVGPLLPLIVEDPFVYAEFNALAKLMMCAAMIVGRLETLAVVALFSPALWRR